MNLLIVLAKGITNILFIGIFIVVVIEKFTGVKFFE